jgi:hypothetical protein
VKRLGYFVAYARGLLEAASILLIVCRLSGTRWFLPAYLLWLVAILAPSWRRVYLAERERRRTYRAAMAEAKRWAP